VFESVEGSSSGDQPNVKSVGRDGRIRWIHSGFSGPGTGDHHEQLVAEMELKISSLLDETAG